MRGKDIALLGLVALCAIFISLRLSGSRSTAAPRVTVSETRHAATSTASREPVRAALPNNESRVLIRRNTAVKPASASVVAPVQTTSATTSVPLPTVSITLQDPDGTNTFPVDLRAGTDACQVLEEAKAEGKIRSLTIDDSYKESFGSSYVREINGYSNNWTFKVGNTYPHGCSLYKPQTGDTIVWMFGG